MCAFFASNSRFTRLFQAALDTCLDSPLVASLSVHGLRALEKSSSEQVSETQIGGGGQNVPNARGGELAPKVVLGKLGLLTCKLRILYRISVEKGQIQQPPENSEFSPPLNFRRFDPPKVFLNNFRLVPDSCCSEEGKSSREPFEKVRVNAVFFLVFLDFGWVFGPLPSTG